MADLIDAGEKMISETSRNITDAATALTSTSGLIDNDIIANNMVGNIFKYFQSRSSFIYTAVFIVLIFMFSSLLDTILVNQTGSLKSSIFIKYSVRWWVILFCIFLVYKIFM